MRKGENENVVVALLAAGRSFALRLGTSGEWRRRALDPLPCTIISKFIRHLSTATNAATVGGV